MKYRTMENLEMTYDMRGDGKTVRFMDYVVTAFWSWDATSMRSKFEFHAFRPIEEEGGKEGLGFCELRLECIDDILTEKENRGGYETEGEALLSAFQMIQKL